MPSIFPGAGMPLSPTFGSAMDGPRHRWGWFVALGVLAIVFGTLALAAVIAATLTMSYVIAILMILAGAAEITVGVEARMWGRSSRGSSASPLACTWLGGRVRR